MIGSTDLEGVPDSITARWIWSGPGCQIAEISAERRGAAAGDEVAARVHGVCPLPMGMEREDRCE